MRAVLVAVLLLASPAFAQQFDETITVNVVDVPVFVERFLRPVTGLDRDDFELYVNGQRHEIEYFEVIKDAGAAETDPDVPSDLKRRRLVVLLFDVDSATFLLRRATEAAMEYVAASAPTDTFAVATLGWKGVTFVVPFTMDRVAVQRAVATLRPSRAGDPFRVATLDHERPRPGAGRGVVSAKGALAPAGPGQADSTGVGPAEQGATAVGYGDEGLSSGGDADLTGIGNAGAFESPIAPARLVASEIDYLADPADRNSRAILDNLIDLAEPLTPLEGIKEVVLFSQGISDVGSVYTAIERQARISLLHERYRAAGVILNAVDINLPRTPGVSASTKAMTSMTPNLRESEFHWRVAAATGGIAVSSLRELESRDRPGYLIGFRPPASDREKNTIRIRLKDAPMLTELRYRKSYSLERRATDEGLFLADVLLNDIPQNGVTLDLSVKEGWLAARIPGIELLSHSIERRLELDVYLYVFDGTRAVAWNRMRLALDLEKGREFLSANPYAVQQEFRLEPGQYVAKAMVRIVGSDRVGFARVKFAVAPS